MKKIAGNKWGQILILLVAPFILTPNEFLYKSGKIKGVWGRIPILAAGLSASWFFSFLYTLSMPHFILNSSIELPDKGFSTTILTAISIFIIIILAASRWLWNAAVCYVSSLFSYKANRARFSYFWITSCSYLVWMGILIFSAAILFISFSRGLGGVYSLLENQPLMVIVILISAALLKRRQQAISAQSQIILYPSFFAQFVNFSPAIIIIIISLVLNIIN